MRSRKIFRDKQKHTDLEKYMLSGPVKQEMMATYRVHVQAGVVAEGKIEAGYSGGDTNYITTYDEAGNIIKEEGFGTSGREIELYKNGYHTKTVKYNTDDSVRETTDIIYNNNGRLIDYTSRNGEGNIRYRSVPVYDAEGNKLEDIVYNGNTEADISSRTVSHYNEWGKADSIIKYDKEGRINHKSTMKYDDRGNLTEDLSEYFEERMIDSGQRIVYINNKYGDCVEMTMYKLDGTINNHFTFNYEYDSNGKKIINQREDIISDLEPGESDKEIVTDKYGNWIRKVRYHNEKPVNVFVRRFTYYGDEDTSELVHPLSQVKETEEVFNTNNKVTELDEEEVKWMAKAGTTNTEVFPLFQYYLMKFKEIPSVTTYTGPYIEARQLVETLQEKMGATLLHSVENIWNGNPEELEKYTLGFSYNPYLLHTDDIDSYKADDFLLPGFIESYYSSYVHVGKFKLLRPGNDSKNRDEYFESELDEYIQLHSLEKKPDKPVINIIQVANNNFSMKEYPVEDNFEIRDLDVNYGYGFEKFHKDLMSRFNNSTKGLVLFHGEPGTGKTYYIRHLLRSMVSNKKVVIYMPPNMVDHLVEPVFMTFLSARIRAWSDAGNFCVLLIEDAEPLLAKRQEGVRIQGITNLLNMSDGLLNDMLNLQIICTFNVGLRKLDSALLRPGRLIARKEFKALSELDANLLAQRIGVKHHFTKPATLGEIYAMKKDQSILIHDVDSDENSSTIIDDLI